MDVTTIFSSNVFDDNTMKTRLPKDTYKALTQSLVKGIALTPPTADVIANAMKDWAIEKGATHYSHWFQPLTGMTAEKHDSFLSLNKDGSVIMEFSGNQLIQGEPDASSFPSGGLRATFEARGYTAWDATSPAFLKEDSAGNVTLCIPTAFCSYNGHALDKKTPLLRSMEVVSKQSLRVLKALGNTTTKRVYANAGAEQEYFLVDKDLYAKRLDLLTCGRTLFGSPAPKGQEMDDHYFGAIKDRVSIFMKDLDCELWKMGITSKTKHNEVAPGQYEMAPIYSSVNVAADHNQLVMETMKKVALRHDLVCLLHEKPYAGVNGSGKHNNWNLSTDDGINLQAPGKTPQDNVQFLLFLAALIKAVDVHSDILRASAANSGNDHRLGANEAPPAVISIFMGKALTDILNNISKGKKGEAKNQAYLKVGVDSLPPLPMDNSDRNRTSPFAFTGNRFEFRMVPSSASVSGPNIVLNVIVSEVLDELATKLEKTKDVNKESDKYIRDIVKKHGKIIFNGDGYGDKWLKEAAKRKLPNMKSTVEALDSIITKKSMDLFDKYKVLSNEELQARHEIYTEQYSQQINIEGQTAVSMARRLYIPAIIDFTTQLAASVCVMRTVESVTYSVQEQLLSTVSEELELVNEFVGILEENLLEAKKIKSYSKQAKFYRDDVCFNMNSIRECIDKLETLLPESLWPVPSYADLMFKI